MDWSKEFKIYVNKISLVLGVSLRSMAQDVTALQIVFEIDGIENSDSLLGLEIFLFCFCNH